MFKYIPMFGIRRMLPVLLSLIYLYSLQEEAESVAMETIRNNLWIWGHPANALAGAFGLDKQSNISPVEGMRLLGAENIFYVPMGRLVDRVACNREMKDVRRIGWSIESEQNALDLIAQKKHFTNLSIAIFDDFFCEENTGSNYTRFPVEKMLELREKLHAANIEMWCVFYTRNIASDTWRSYLRLFDGVSCWFWSEPDETEFNTRLEWFLRETDGQKRMIGCYLYNFGEMRPATPQNVRNQLDKDLSLMRDGQIQGIILHTNAIGGLGFAAWDEAVSWVRTHGDIPLTAGSN